MAANQDALSDGFLPQYAAHAVVDLEKTAKRLRRQQRLGYYTGALGSVAGLIRHAVHVVLPENGEVYRSNKRGGDMPSGDECESFMGLPAPVTCFEYHWSHPDNAAGDGGAPRRITIVSDGKQIHKGPYPEGMVPCATIFSVVYSETVKTWLLMDVVLEVKTPLEVLNKPDTIFWGPLGRARNLVTGEQLSFDDPKSMKAFGEFIPDLNSVIQCCHALRAGAGFDERIDKSASRNWKFEKRGVGGFTYHVLKLPQNSIAPCMVASGSHESPRCHVRRAHIRKLPTGLLTFVRQCFVGDKARGLVEKHYEVGSMNGATPAIPGPL